MAAPLSPLPSPITHSIFLDRAPSPGVKKFVCTTLSCLPAVASQLLLLLEPESESVNEPETTVCVGGGRGSEWGDHFGMIQNGSGLDIKLRFICLSLSIRL